MYGMLVTTWISAGSLHLCMTQKRDLASVSIKSQGAEPHGEVKI